MSQPPLLLVHASDLHLERPVFGLMDVPDQLRDLLLDAPFQAAETVVETALAENADALLLAGDVLDVPRAGPHGLVFLLEQFARLKDRKIPVYWAGGAVDAPDDWPRSVPLPENVHVFPTGGVADLHLEREGEKVALVQGVSQAKNGNVDTSGFHRDAHGLTTIGVAYGTEDSAGHEGDRVHYMALGGRHRRETVDEEPGIAHYCGTPQGRRPRETGPHGCTVVQWDNTGRARLRPAATDVVRWIDESLEITASTEEGQLYDRLAQRIKKLTAENPGVDLLVSWKIRGSGRLANRLRPGGLSDELIAQLRKQFGHGSPVCWSVTIDCESPLTVPDEWYDQETVLGDLLRQFRAFRDPDRFELDLQPFLPAELHDELLARIAHIADQRERSALLQNAAKLGVDLLTNPSNAQA